jgi:proteasome lid subunit RPN8/RPN11
MQEQDTTLVIEQHVADAMLAAARKAAPEEACGLLAGTDGRVSATYDLTNVDASGEHYSMLPEEQFAAVKDMRAKGLRMLGIWHSHPATPARMSDEDLRLAYTPEVVYVIVSLATRDKPDIRGFAVHNATSTEVNIVITNPLRQRQGQPNDE